MQIRRKTPTPDTADLTTGDTLMIDKKSHWQNIYQQRSATTVSWYQQAPTLSMDLIRRACIHPDDAIVDVGGGASVLADYLLNAGFNNLTVLDISGNALSSAQKRLGAAANRITWIETDITIWRPPHAFCLWHDRAVFHFLTRELERKNYIKVLKQALSPGGHLIMAAFAIGGPRQCSGLDIVQYNSDKLSAELGGDFNLMEEINETHTTPDSKTQKFTYFRFSRRSA